tara:strand:+ start:19760 stop:20017 length:258 start_codon:yes stop_codon:yes gene_type:complete
VQQAKYLNDLLCECAPENGFAQEAIEFAVLSGSILLSFDMETDTYQIMRMYDDIIDRFREVRTRECISVANRYKSVACAEEVSVD